ncbi:MAG TPA: hypothetical protein VHZ98_02330 [Galbitalea sp.]|jgi:hypothetical protein|nr:hypothetical protein [Galbitalea sp.]
MSPLLVAFLPGAVIGVGLALLLLRAAPRLLRTGDALTRLGDVSPSPVAAASTKVSERLGNWVHQHAPTIPGFTAPLKQLDLLEIPVSRFYGQKLQLAGIGFIAPIILPIFFQLTLGYFFALPLLLCPVLAIIMWTVPDGTVRAKAKDAQREFTRFVTVYLELVAVALLGDTTTDSALTSAAGVSDTWVFRRIRREYRVADLTRVSKWDALEHLGTDIEVPALVDMSRLLRLSEARVGLREQLRAACRKLRAQVAADDKDAAQRLTSRMDLPVLCCLLPILAITITPTLLQLTTL